jgi:hypothetical protein
VKYSIILLIILLTASAWGQYPDTAVGDTAKGTASLSNRGTTPVIIDSIRIVPSEDFILVLDSVQFPDTLDVNKRATYAVLFVPRSPGKKNAKVEYYLDSAGKSFDTLYGYLQGTGLGSSVNENIFTEVPENSNVYRDAKERLDRGGEGFFVQSVYPNPAEKQVSFVYATSEPMVVTLDIFDMLGKPLRRQVSVSTYQKGVYQISCDISSYPRGSYIYRLQGGSTVISGKLLIEH